MTSVRFERVAVTYPSITPSSVLVSSHLISGMRIAQNKKARAEAPAKALDPEGETGDRSSGREKVARMSGGLLLVAVAGIKGLRMGEAQVHQARFRDALVAPL